MATRVPPFALPRASLAIGTAFATLYLVWGTTYLAIAVAIQTLPPFLSGAMRFLLAGGLVYAWLRLKGPRPFEGVDLKMSALCGVLLSGIGNGLIVWSQQGIPSGIAALIVTAVPVIVLVLDWAFFSKRAPTRQALLGTAVAVAGVATIVMHTRTLSGDAEPLYLIGLLLATVGWSLGTLLQKRAAKTHQVLSFTSAQMLFGGVFQLVLATLNWEWGRFDPSAVSLSSVLAVLYLVTFGSVLGVTTYLWLLTRVSAPKVTTYALVNPVVALILGALILNERLTSLTVLAAALVLFGVSLVLFQEAKPLQWVREWRARVAARDAA